MDGFQFIASIIGSLAWPAAVLIALFVMRSRIEGLFGVLKEAQLPWGIKLTFDRAMANAALQAELIAPQVRGEAKTDDTRPNPAFIAFATEHPEAAVLQCFREIEQTLWDIVRFLPLPTKQRDNDSVLQELVRLGYINDNAVALFENLRDARNAAVHAGKSVRLSPTEALRYFETTKLLFVHLRDVLRKLEIDNPRKKAWG
jgi:hypothetical protein